MPEQHRSQRRTKALVLGVNGQDGSYIADCLIAAGYHVTGVGRQTAARWVDAPGFDYVSMDITNLDALQNLLAASEPDRIYNFAAVHGSAGYRYEDVARQAHTVNILTVQIILDFILRKRPACRLVYPSSAKTYGTTLPDRIDDLTPRASDCIYSITKNAARDLIHYYRDTHDIHASVVTLFNHESARRQPGYFVPTLVRHAASALLQPGYRGSVYSLSMACDWGDAAEYAALIVAASELETPEDFIIATGNCITGQDLAMAVFGELGLDYQDHVTVTTTRDANASLFQVDTSKLRRLLWVPREPILKVCMDMLKSNHGDAWVKRKQSK